MRFLLDTNILIPLQDSNITLSPNLKSFIRLANKGGHQLLYHPASLIDIQRDGDLNRRQKTLDRLDQYERLDINLDCPWNECCSSPNDRCDNEILYALYNHAVHALVTEDKGIHNKGKRLGLSEKIYSIQTAEDLLKRLHDPKEIKLPKIEEVSLFNLTNDLESPFFDSLRTDYDFNRWFKEKASEGRKAWIYRDDEGLLAAICIYTIQCDVVITDNNEKLNGNSLKLCTFKVGETVRGRKVGELFLKAAFKFASKNFCEHIFIHGNAEKQPALSDLLEDFGFYNSGVYQSDTVWVKNHPKVAPATELCPRDYARRYFPHFRQDASVQKYIVPIQPKFHEILFPDYQCGSGQINLFEPNNNVGNAIKLAYLCASNTSDILPGDILFFYRSKDEMAITSLGVVDEFRVSNDANEIASLVSRRTVYSYNEIQKLALKNVKVILFRLIKHLEQPVSRKELLQQGIIAGTTMSIVKINESKFRKLADVIGI